MTIGRGAGRARGDGGLRTGREAGAATTTLRFWFRTVIHEARQVRSFGTAVVFVRWLTYALTRPRRSRRLARAWAKRRDELAASPVDGAELTARIHAVGERAKAVFAGTANVAEDPRHMDIDVAVVDGRHDTPCVDVPVVRLTEAPALAAPVVDPRRFNPIGWSRNVEAKALSLGPVCLLRPGVKVAGQVEQVDPADSAAIRRCHHVVDVAGFHATPEARARTLIRISALGIPVHLADPDARMKVLLGAPLYGEMRQDHSAKTPLERELTSVRMRRIALRDHSVTSRSRQIYASALGAAPDRARVSIVLATRRPWQIEQIIESVAKQTYPNLELVLVLHGDGLDLTAIRSRLTAALDIPATVLAEPAERVFGEVLTAATEAASGTLITKMDDDDVYGPEHIWDLVLALEYSGANLVGKCNEVVYLSDRDETALLHRDSERISHHVTGSALLIPRHDLDRFGGWPNVHRSIDVALARAVVQGYGVVYRTHGFGYVFVRHNGQHTWTVGDDHFLQNAVAVYPGWRPELAGMPGEPRPSLDRLRRG